MRIVRPMFLALLLAKSSIGRPAVAEPPARYRISGVAVSTRDGSPVPYCRISATSVVRNENGSASAPPRGPAPGSGPGSSGGAPPRGDSAPARNFNPPVQATADASGRFNLEVPHFGAWRLAAVARGFRSQNYDAHEGLYSEIVLTETAPAYSLTFRLHPNSALTGVIFDEAGEPIASAQVTAILIPPSIPGGAPAASRQRPTGTGQTDDRGRYEIGGLAPGQYRVHVQAQPWYAAQGRAGMMSAFNGQTPSPDPSLDFVYPVTWFPGTDDEASADTIPLADGEERQADLHLTATPSIHLRIPRTDVAAQQPTAPGQARNRQQQFRPATVTRVGGDPSTGFQQVNPGGMNGNEWDFGGLAPGIYEVRIPNADGRTNDVRQIEVRPGSQTVVTLEGAKPLIPVELKLDGMPNINGASVEFLDSETGARISSNRQRGPEGLRPGPLEDREPDAETSASRTVMLPGHEFSVQVNGNSGAYLTGITAEGAKVMGRLVTISGPATLTMHLANKRASLDGVARIAGAPAAGAMVLLVPATFGMAGDLNTIQRDETNTDGSFQISGITPGQYILVVIDHGWNVDWRDPATLGQYLLHGKPVDLRGTPKVHEELEAVAKF